MKFKAYTIYVEYELIDIYDYHVEYQTEEFYAESYDDALKESDKHTIGSVEGEYADGVICKVVNVEISEEMEEIEFY